jgi:chitinase
MRQTGAALTATALFYTASAFSQSSNNNLVVYWGQNSAGSQQRLSSYCQDSTVDVIPISFLTAFGVGAYQLNFANACGGTPIAGSGMFACDQIAADIKTCQVSGKKILLSMGGASGAYGFNSAAQAQQVADDLWNYFGGGSSSIRPFGDAQLDGFDLDIENNNPAFYPDFISRMRSHYASQSAKQYYIAGAPQCVYPDASLATALAGSWFDMLYIQFYNNYCGIYQYGTNNFNYDVWDKWAREVSVNKDVKLYLGVAAAIGAANAGTGYVPPETMVKAAKELQAAYPKSFGGVMMWDASQAYANTPAGYSINYAQIAKQALGGGSVEPALPKTTVATGSPINVQMSTVAPAQPTTPVAQEPITTPAPAIKQPVPVSSSPAAPAPGNCYLDFYPNGRALDKAVLIADNMTPAVCSAFCASKGFAYAGTEYYNECYCGARLPSQTASNCNFKCKGDSNQICGGDNALSVVFTDGVAAVAPAPAAASSQAPVAAPAASSSAANVPIIASPAVPVNTPVNVAPPSPPQSATPAVPVVPIDTPAPVPAPPATPNTPAPAVDNTCPVSGGACVEGSYQCNGYGYAQCLWGKWVLRECGATLACAGSGNNIYCDFVNGAQVTCSGIVGKTHMKRDASLDMSEEMLEPEVKTVITSHKLDGDRVGVTLRAHAVGIAPIREGWFFTFKSDKRITSSDIGVLEYDARQQVYTVSSDPGVEMHPTREIVINLEGEYESKQRSTWGKSWW